MIIGELIGCTVDFRGRLIHFEIILPNNTSMLGLCNKAIPYYNVENILSKEIIFGKEISNGKYVIENIPLYTKNLELGDILLAERLDDGKLYFEDLLETSENSTVRVIFFNYDETIVLNFLKEMEKCGVNWVGFIGGSYYSMNINKELDYKPIKNFLEQNRGIIDYEEACLSDKHKSDLL